MNTPVLLIDGKPQLIERNPHICTTPKKPKQNICYRVVNLSEQNLPLFNGDDIAFLERTKAFYLKNSSPEKKVIQLWLWYEKTHAWHHVGNIDS